MPPGPNPNSQYRLGPDSMPQEGVPKGEIRGPFVIQSKVYPGTQHTYWVYVPAQYDPDGSGQPDGLPGRAGVQGRERRPARAERDGQPDLPPRDSGDDRRLHQSGPHAPSRPEPSPQTGWGDGTTNRGTEYNTPDDKYARVITEELMPALNKDYNISKDPEQRGIGGSSSGAIAAFAVAWERPNEFRKVLSNVGSFTNLRGGYVYPERVLASEKKPIRVFLCDGRNDNRAPARRRRPTTRSATGSTRTSA